MNRVPGLGPMNEDTRRSRGTVRERARAQEIAPEQVINVGPLQPRAAPVFDYARPAQPVRDDSLDQLAASLAGVSRSMLGYMESTKGAREEDQTDRLLAATAGQDQQGLLRVLAENPDAQSRVGHRLVSGLLGRRIGDDLALRAEELFETQFDKDNGDLDLWLNEQAQMVAEGNADNPAVMGEFLRVWGPAEARIRAKHAEWRAGRANENVNSLVSQSWLAGMDAGLREGRDPDELFQEIVRNTYDTNRALLGTDYARQDEILLETITSMEQRARQNPERFGEWLGAVEAIMANERVGGDGTKLGAFGDSEVGKRALPVLDRMYREADRIAKEQSYQQVMGAVRDRAVTEAYNGTLHTFSSLPEAERTIIDANGNPKVLSPDEINRIAAESLLEQEAAIANRDEDPDGSRAFNRQLDVFTRNPSLVHPRWSATLQNGASAAFTLVEGDKIPPILLEATELYGRMRAQAPMQVPKYTDDRGREFYETVETLHGLGIFERTPEGRAAAVRQAVHAVRDPERVNQIWNRFSQTQINEAKSQTWSSMGWLFDSSSLGNAATTGDLMEQVEKGARILSAATGMDPKQALAATAERVKQNYRTVRGTAVRVNPAFVPADFDQMVNEHVDEWATRNGYDPADVSIRSAPNTDNVWTITVEGFEAEEADAFITLDMLYRKDGERRQKALEEARARSEEARKRRAGAQEPPNGGIVPTP